MDGRTRFFLFLSSVVCWGGKCGVSEWREGKGVSYGHEISRDNNADEKTIKMEGREERKESK